MTYMIRWFPECLDNYDFTNEIPLGGWWAAQGGKDTL